MTTFAKVSANRLNMNKPSSEVITPRLSRDRWEKAQQVQTTEYKGLPLSEVQGVEPEYEEVELSRVIENPYNARELYDLSRIERLAASITLDGQLVPAISVRRGDKYLLIAGHYRFKALKRGGFESIKMMVYPEDVVSDQKIYEFSFKENEERSEQTAMDNAFAWKRVLDKGVYGSITALSEAIGVSQPNITKTLSMLSLPDAVLDVIKDAPDRFGLSLAYELQRYAKLAPEAKSVEFALQIKDNEISRKEIMAARAALETKAKSPEKRKNQMSRSYPLDYDLGKGSVKEWDNGKVQVDIRFSTDEEKVRFLEYVQRYQSAK